MLPYATAQPTLAHYNRDGLREHCKTHELSHHAIRLELGLKIYMVIQNDNKTHGLSDNAGRYKVSEAILSREHKGSNRLIKPSH